jgi:hypothetical protein
MTHRGFRTGGGSGIGDRGVGSGVGGSGRRGSGASRSGIDTATCTGVEAAVDPAAEEVLRLAASFNAAPVGPGLCCSPSLFTNLYMSVLYFKV